MSFTHECRWRRPLRGKTHNHIRDRGARYLVGWKAAGQLSVLHLKYNPITDAGAVVLLDSPDLHNLEGLQLSGTSELTAARMATRCRYHHLSYH